MTPSEELRSIAAVRIQAHSKVLASEEIADLIFVDLTALGFAVVKRGEVPPWMEIAPMQNFATFVEHGPLYRMVEHDEPALGGQHE